MEQTNNTSQDGSQNPELQFSINRVYDPVSGTFSWLTDSRHLNLNLVLRQVFSPESLPIIHIKNPNK